ncbi:S-adenosyl-L-methionine-dependent methyltransferase [Lentinula detonsa]|uniref:S-adenosyl-L-methionine-dependent methyltransferase n=1 Tax=Lentinula detonsa TaxID=2804962 RepID=A0AA38Q3S0_9AGAR|nr:S-adenosyl-L-methionine-dependent methyltransferase [Lentinula detonsa]
MNASIIANPTAKRASSVHDVNSLDPPFGSRYLVDSSLTFTQNAWDHVPPPVDQGATIAASLARQRAAVVSEEEKLKINSKPAKYWDNFYKNNEGNFFKDRKWLHNEFPDLVAAAEPTAGSLKIAEFGCGAGNSIFPVLSANKNPLLELYAYDYSSHAVKLVQHNPLYNSPSCGSIHAAVWDLASDHVLPPGLVPGSVDIVILVFVLSALHPDEWASAIRNVQKVLKPGTGKVLFRDYGRYDLTQLRFKSGRMMGDNFYKRGDGTRVYFFELDELSLLFTGKRLSKEEKDIANSGADTTQMVEDEEDPGTGSTSEIPSIPSHVPTTIDEIDGSSPAATDPRNATAILLPIQQSGMLFPSDISTSRIDLLSPNRGDLDIHPKLLDPLFDGTGDTNKSDGQHRMSHHPLFSTINLGIDRRLIVNRKRQLKMYRVWMQGVFQKNQGSIMRQRASEN